MRNLVGKTDSMANYSLLRVDGGRRKEKRMDSNPFTSYFGTSQVALVVKNPPANTEDIRDW